MKRAPTVRILTLLGAIYLTSCSDPSTKSAIEAETAKPSTSVATETGSGDASKPSVAKTSLATEAQPQPTPLPPGDLINVAAARGLVHRNHSGETSKQTILEAGGAGVALLDLGNDDDLDIVFSQGLGSLGQLVTGPGADIAIFENDGDGNFTELEGPGLSGWWTGVAAGDVDSDGDADLVVGGFGCLAVLLQDDKGRLHEGPSFQLESPWTLGSDVEAGAAPSWITSLALLDLDRDGLLDLYLGHYLELDPVNPAIGELGEGELALPCRWRGHEVYCGPRGLVPQPDRVLRGLGAGRFEDRTRQWLPDHPAGFTLAVHPFDADGDGDTDVAVANDSSPNLLLINDGRGLLIDHGFAAGVALSTDGRPEAGMGIATGDFDRDGRPDMSVTNFSDEPTSLYLGAAVGFENRTYKLGLARATRRLLSWGVHMNDFDGDGWLDLFTANGHVYPQADRANSGTSYGQADTLWLNAAGTRLNAAEGTQASSILRSLVGTRGSAVGDLDGDGAPDVVSSHIDALASLGRNTWANRARLVIELQGPQTASEATPRTPRDAMGARAIVVADIAGRELGMVAEVQTSIGYQSSSSPWLNFGLGRCARYKSLLILWPSGRKEELPGGLVGKRLTIREGEGIVAETEL